MDDPTLKQIADNPALLEALRRLLERQFEPPVDFGTIDSATSDLVLGQMLRGRIAGLNGIRDALKEIEKYKTIPPRPESVNPAR